MSDQSIIPLSDEQAKAAQEAFKSMGQLGSYLADILGDAPKDFFSLIVGDQLKVWRTERLANLWRKAKGRLEQQGIKEPTPPNLKLALPILASAADEPREELQDLWARLLAASMNPNKALQVRQAFIEAMQKLDPLDARLLDYLPKVGGSFGNQTATSAASSLGISSDELAVSQRNLNSIGLTADINKMTYALMPFGREFLRCVS